MGAHHAQAAGEPSRRGLPAVRDLYDRLVEMDPEAAVALYSFGDRAVLDAATAEVVGYLRERGLLTAQTRLLDLGCGIGRLLEACAPHCRSLVGIDVSPRMVALASSRLAPRTNVRVELGSGLDLGAIVSASQDVVLAADSWPHVVDLGGTAVTRLAEEVARVLVPGGHFVVLNFSYRDDAALDVADVRQLAAAIGFEVVEEGARPFTLWDASAWRLRRLEDNPRG
jgi:SAM-dependent methyltransferase